MTRCPRCAGRLRKIGPPQLHGAFVDQLLDCPACDWCGVESTYTSPGRQPDPQPTQLEMELDL